MNATVAVDLHRRRSVVLGRDEQGEELLWVRLTNEPDRLVEAVLAYGEAPDVAIEATYGWYWAVDALQAAGANVHLVAPARVAAFEGRRVKSDISDCGLARRWPRVNGVVGPRPAPSVASVVSRSQWPDPLFW